MLISSFAVFLIKFIAYMLINRRELISMISGQHVCSAMQEVFSTAILLYAIDISIID